MRMVSKLKILSQAWKCSPNLRFFRKPENAFQNCDFVPNIQILSNMRLLIGLCFIHRRTKVITIPSTSIYSITISISTLLAFQSHVKISTKLVIADCSQDGGIVPILSDLNSWEEGAPNLVDFVEEMKRNEILHEISIECFREKM